MPEGRPHTRGDDNWCQFSFSWDRAGNGKDTPCFLGSNPPLQFNLHLSVCICQLSVVRCRILRTRAYLPGVPCRAGEGVQRRSWPPRLDVGDGDPKLPGAGTAPGYGPPPRWGESNGCSVNDQGRVPPLANKNQLAIPLDLRPPAACRFYSAFS